MAVPVRRADGVRHVFADRPRRLVTSHEAGMSVPDWPNELTATTCSRFPIKFWKGGAFFRTHAPAAGFGRRLADNDSRRLALAERFAPMDALAWRCRISRRGCAGSSRRFAGDVAHGQLGIFHGDPSRRLFFVLMCAIALFTSRFWHCNLDRRDAARSIFRPARTCAAMFCSSRF